MTGPPARDVHEVMRLFDLEALRNAGEPCVDYILGAEPGGGVFCIGYCDHPYQRSMMSYYKMGPGPFYLFYRPYHLCHVEAIDSIAAAALDGCSLLEPYYGFRTNVFAYAKCDLKAGETLDGIGGYLCYGQIENCAGGSHPGLPICLAEGLVLRTDVVRDAPIPLTAVRIPPDAPGFEMYASALAAGAVG
jgi:predicted homoserine dehydrogenase-like protein